MRFAPARTLLRRLPVNVHRALVVFVFCAGVVSVGPVLGQEGQPPVVEQPDSGQPPTDPVDDVDSVDPPPRPPAVDLPPLSTNPFQDWLRGPRSVRERSRSRLASAPDMFGDSLRRGTVGLGGLGTSFASFPIAGSGAVKIAENGNAGVKNRLIFDVRHFDAGTEFLDGGAATDRGFQRYTFGFEKAIDDSRSIGVRMPVVAGGDVDPTVVDPNQGVLFDFGGIQSVTLLFKQELERSETLVVSTGLGLGVPVQHDTEIFEPTTRSDLRVRPEAVHFQPFVGFLATPTDDFFLQGFLQFDFASTGNPVDRSIRGTTVSLGRLNPQSLMFVDLAGGVWLVRNDVGLLRGLAGVVEFHYTTTLSDADAVVDSQGSGLAIGNDANRVDLAHFTTGLHFDLAGDTAVRFGVVLPANDGFDRVFDGEIVGSVIKTF